MIRTTWRETSATPWRDDRGGVVVEFALIVLALYLLLAFILDFGRLFFTAQALQEAARVAAREFALLPLPAATTFEQALQDPAVRATIYDPGRLVIAVPPDNNQLQALLDALPIMNKALVPLMIQETFNDVPFLRYPGALVADPTAPDGFTVAIPRVVSRGADGVETIEWVAPIEEIRPNPADPLTGPFSVASTGPQQGLVAIRLNYPYQAAILSGFQQGPNGPFEPGGALILADDAGVVQQNALPPGQTLLAPAGGLGPYGGSFGLGHQLAWGQTLRPFRKLLAAQAIFRREVLL